MKKEKKNLQKMVREANPVDPAPERELVPCSSVGYRGLTVVSFST